MPVYLELFHGRSSTTEQLDDWGLEGPILGPLAHVHTTYATDIKVETKDGVSGVLHLACEDSDLLFYDGIHYGDWSVFAEEVMALEPALTARVQQFDPAKTHLPSTTG